jgi:ElaB/YqjD/DUF883 family membrane-anchored ribosome-binding protein
MNKQNGNGEALDERLDSIKASVKGLVDTGGEKVEAIKTKVIDVKDQAMERGNALLDGATDLIKAHPFKAIGIAFAAGYVGMRLFRR